MKNLWIKGALSTFLVAAFMALPDKAMPLTLTFCRITSNSLYNVEGQFTVNVTNPGGGQIQFDFFNAGPINASITDIYFDDSDLLDPPNPDNLASLDHFIDNAFVEFDDPATPSDLPGGNNADPDFVTTDDFSADSNTPITANGIGAGETLGIVFNLAGGRTFGQVLTDLQNGNLRIGLHVQAIGGEGGASDSFVNCPAPVPEPGTLILLGSGLLASGGVARLRRKK